MRAIRIALVVAFMVVASLPLAAVGVIDFGSGGAIRDDGSVWTWGYNDRGQLGDGTTRSRSSPGRVAGSDLPAMVGFAQTMTGRVSSIAVGSDGSVWAWGGNVCGWLGDGTTIDRHTPVQVRGPGGVGYLDNVAQVVAGGGYWDGWVVARRTDGTLWAWGNNHFGQLGDGTTSNRYTPVQVRGPGGVGHMGNVADVVNGWYGCVMARKTDGTLWAWGNNWRGQLGDGTTTERHTPVQVLGPGGVGYLGNVVQVVAGFSSVVVRKTDGTLWAWGGNDHGQLGDGTTVERHTPVRVRGPGGAGYLGNVAEVVLCGSASVMVRKTDGTLWAWGANGAGELGDGTTISRSTPVQVRGPGGAGYLGNVAEVFSSGDMSVMARKTDGTLWAWGKNYSGQLGDGTTISRSTPVQVRGPGGAGYLGNVAEVFSSGDISVARKTDGTLWAWGNNRYGRLGDGTTSNRYTPVAVGYPFGGASSSAGETKPPAAPPKGENPGTNKKCGLATSSPVYTRSGNYFVSETDAVIPDRGLPIQITRYYQTLDDYAGPFSRRWNFNHTIQLIVQRSNDVTMATIRWADGVRRTFTLQTNGVWAQPVHIYDTFMDNGTNASPRYTYKTKNGMKLYFSSIGRLTKQEDPNTNSLTFNYNGAGRIQAVTTASGRSITYSYNSHNLVSQISDWAGRSWKYAYDTLDNLVAVTNPAGESVHYLYDTNCNLTAIIDAAGLTNTVISYDPESSKCLSYTEQGGLYAFDYAPAGQSNTTIKLDPLNRTNRYVYNEYGNKQVHESPGAVQIQRQWTTNQEIGAVTDPRGYTQRYQYDSRGNVTATTNALGQVTRYTYETNFNRVVTITDPLGGVVSNSYDANGNLVFTRDPRGFTTTYSYDPSGHLTNTVNPRGFVSRMAYDSYGNLLTAMDPLSNTVSYVYDTRGNRTRMTDARGNAWGYGYDGMDRLIAETNPLGQVSSYVYDSRGLRIRMTDARTNSTTFGYDEYGRLVASTNALGFVTTYQYDILGNQVSTVDALGNSISNSYDQLNRVIQTTDPLGNPLSFAYDASGNQIAVTDALGRVSRKTYDALNRVVEMTNAVGAVVRYNFDANGNLTAVIDGNNHTNKSWFDARNMVTNAANGLGLAYRYTYDANGNIATRIDPNGATLQYSYDNADRLTDIVYPDGSRLALAYDANGNTVSLSNTTETVVNSYDALNRLTNVLIVGLNKAISYEYDAVGNRAAMVDPDGGRTLYTYDALNRLESLQDPGTNTWTFGYDPINQMTNAVMPNGIQCAYQYDQASRLTNLVYTTSTNSILQSFAYTYDAVGNPLRVRREDSLYENYAYDAIDQLTRVDYDAAEAGGTSTNFTTYKYDFAGNRTLHSNATGKVIYNYDAANRLLSVSSTVSLATYRWDNNGNLTNKVEDGTNTWYAWDVENKMVSIRYQNGLTNTFSYYPSSSLRHTKIDSAGTNRYVYDGQNELQQLDGLRTLVAQYTYSLGIDSLLARSAGGSQNYYLRDMLGSVTAVADPEQNLAATYRYDAFGSVRRQTGAANNPYLFTARSLDQDSGLYYYRARFMDPRRGVFVSRDPAGMVGGLNAYNYVDSSPQKYTDPLGLFSWKSLGAAVLHTAASAGSIAESLLPATGAAFSFKSGNVAGFASGWFGALDKLNTATKHSAAAWENVYRAFTDQEPVYDIDRDGAFDSGVGTLIAPPKIRKVNRVYRLVSGVLNLADKAGDSSLALTTYSSMLSPETKSLAELQNAKQLLYAVNVTISTLKNAGTTASARKSIVSESCGK